MAYRRGGVGYGRMKKGPRFEAKAQELKAVSLASASKSFIQNFSPFSHFIIYLLIIFNFNAIISIMH